MTTLSAITTINEVLATLKPDSDLAQALNTALSALRERHHGELAGQQKNRVMKQPRDYPMTIVKDRYGGVYSGGAYTAWNLDPWELPSEMADSDLFCGEFWAWNKLPCGKGNTPDEAEGDLLRRIRGPLEGEELEP